METVAIVGVGLMGGSFALALRKAGFRGRILGVSSPPVLEQALSLGIVDEGLPLEDAVPRADLVFLSQTIQGILGTIRRLDPWVKPGSLVTDAGSTKSAIVKAASESLRRAHFLGGHPMAGKESRGVAAADADLFRGRTWILTPAGAAPEPAAEFRKWIEKFGALPVELDAAFHDKLVSRTSHLPQILSTALASLLAGELHLPEDARAAGPALFEATRLALSDYAVWRDIFATNPDNIAAALDLFIAKLAFLRSHLNHPAMSAEFERAATFAAALRRSASFTRPASQPSESGVGNSN